jgi:hypothetical protein
MNKTALACIYILATLYCHSVRCQSLVKITIFSLSSSCAHWNDDRQKYLGAPLSDGSWIARSNDVSWLAGYLSGVNFTSHSGENLLRDIDMDLAADWVDKYCMANPKSDVPSAAGNLFKRLKRIP